MRKKGYIDHQTLSFDAYDKFIEDDFLNGQRIDPAPTADLTLGPTCGRTRRSLEIWSMTSTSINLRGHPWCSQSTRRPRSPEHPNPLSSLLRRRRVTLTGRPVKISDEDPLPHFTGVAGVGHRM